MSRNYPPGVTGTEPQITGDIAWETWAENIKPGDPCVVTWQGVEWKGRFLACTDDGDAEVEILTIANSWLRLVVAWDDVEPPIATAEGM